MRKLAFYMLDVFAEEKYAGNPLAVVRDASGLTSERMQKIAREINFSETAFILSDQPRDGGYEVRIFTPKAEVPFAGHPTLGTAFVIRQEILGTPIETVNLHLKAGTISVTFHDEDHAAGILWMKQKSPIFGRIMEPGPVAKMLGLKTSDVDERFPIQEVSTGLPFVMVPLKTLAAVKQAQVIRDQLFDGVKDTEAKLVFIFCPQVYHEAHRINARMFGDYYGVAEDPATGSANGCLAGYLVKYRYFGEGPIDIQVEQGYEIGRPSLLYLKAVEQDDRIEVSVGGRVVMVAKGEWI